MGVMSCRLVVREMISVSPGPPALPLSSADAGDLNVGDIDTDCRLLGNLNNGIHARQGLAGMFGVGKMVSGNAITPRFPHRILKIHLDVEQTREVEDRKYQE